MQSILFVDDNPLDREFIKEILIGTQSKYNLIEADSGSSALDIVRQKPSALILLDIQMANLDGFQTPTELRKMKDLMIPTILVSSFTNNRSMLL